MLIQLVGKSVRAKPLWLHCLLSDLGTSQGARPPFALDVTISQRSLAIIYAKDFTLSFHFSEGFRLVLFKNEKDESSN